MKKQSFFPRRGDMQPHNTFALSTLGLEQPEFVRHVGKNWERGQVCRQQHFFLNAWETYRTHEAIEYTRQEHYIKFNFWLAGRHLTVLDGFGEHDHDRPEVFITAGPQDMVKVDMCSREVQVASLALCVLKDFFPVQMGVELDQLPEPLRGMLSGDEVPFTFQRLPLTPDLLAAARAILVAPFAVRRMPLYCEAKAVELMCLLFNHMESSERKSAPMLGEPRGRQEARLREAFDFVNRHYAEPITLERISREVGLNKVALTGGFRQLFGMSVYNCIQKARMERAYELLRHGARSVAQVAEAVGYQHASNFSTAFHAYYGCTPQSARRHDA
jgi:AraC-like DNA-binding protein